MTEKLSEDLMLELSYHVRSKLPKGTAFIIFVQPTDGNGKPTGPAQHMGNVPPDCMMKVIDHIKDVMEAETYAMKRFGDH
jgi:hypothetical protein